VTMSCSARAEANKAHSVIDRGNYKSTQESMNHLSPSTEEARSFRSLRRQRRRERGFRRQMSVEIEPSLEA